MGRTCLLPFVYGWKAVSDEVSAEVCKGAVSEHHELVSLRTARQEEVLGAKGCRSTEVTDYSCLEELVPGNEEQRWCVMVSAQWKKGASTAPNDRGEEVSWRGMKLVTEVEKGSMIIC